MFDVNLSELMVIAVVALVVIGPERLPKVARTAGLILGRLQRYVSDVKADINREIQLDELKQLQQQVSQQVTSLEASVTHEMREVESSVDKVIAPLATDIAALPEPTLESVPVVDAQAPAVVAEIQKS
ncbi:MAG: Sec-independent protein translocase protein TatB [Sulfuritalea sp.]|jgi:sec-independent protein translocase protein TatB|nr:Sec-independent protein translocase protein TatB [Sulfuritalea sp.]